MTPLDRYAVIYMAGLAVALFAPIIILLIVATMNLREWREPRDPVKRLRHLEKGRRAQASEYDPAQAPWARRNGAR